MAKLDELKEMLKQYEGIEFTTKNLMDDLNLSSYSIGQLVNQGFLTKVSRGLYKVNVLSEEDSFVETNIENQEVPEKSFKRFRNLVLKGNYELAYDYLIECVEKNKDNHDYDSHYRMYFILLTHILKQTGTKRKLDYDYDDKLLEFYEQYRTEYYEFYANFRDAVLAKKFTEASSYLKVYADKELARYKRNKISTLIFQKLLDEIEKMAENRKNSDIKLDLVYKLAFKREFEELKTALEETVSVLNSHNVKRLCKYLIELCQTVIDFKNDENKILPDKQSYNLSENASLAGAFLYFMGKKDYRNAASYVEKCYQTYGGSLFGAARILLRTLMALNNQNYVNLKQKTEIREMREKTKKNDAKSKQHFYKVLDSLQTADFYTAYNEIKLCLSYVENIRTVLYSNTYSLYILLRYLNDMKDNKTTIEKLDNVYLKSDSDGFNLKRAIRLEDWEATKLYLSKFNFETSKILASYDLVLKEIFRQDEINRGHGLKDEGLDLSSSNGENDNTQNNDEKQTLNTEEEISEIHNEEIVASIDETREIDILDSIKNLKLDFETLYNLVKNREFDEAYALITREEAKGYSIVKETAKEEIKEMQEDTQPDAIEVVEEVSEPVVDEILSEESNAEEANPKVELTEEEKYKLEVLESIKDLELNYENLYDLVYDRKYEEARYLIEREEAYNNRLAVNVHSLICQFQQIQRGFIKQVEQKPIDYSLDDYKIFYALLKNRDYDVALEYVDSCIEHAKDNREFRLLKLLLEDIANAYNNEIEERRKKEEEARQKKEDLDRLDDINNKLRALSYYKQGYSSDEVNNIQSLLEEKIHLSLQYGKETEMIFMLLGVAEAAVMADNNALNLGHFARIVTDNSDNKYLEDTYSADFSTDKTKVGDIFYEALKFGDLITVYEIITTENWNNICGSISPVNLLLIKHLLEFINDRTPLKMAEEELERRKERNRIDKISEEKQKQIDDIAYEVLPESEKDTYHYIAFLKSLDSAVENDHFTDAFNELLDTDVAFNDPEVISNILLAHNVVKEESQVLLDQFLDAERAHNVGHALEALNNYKDYIKGVFADYDINYLYKRVKILEKDLATRNYRDKEKVYEDARSLFNKGQYEKALVAVDKYLSMDRYINSKGFVLKGDIYYHMGNYEKAVEFYLKALKLTQDPTVYLNLGKTYFADGSYEKAIYYLELYIQMNPFRESSVSQMLNTCYEKTGKGVKAKKYIQ